MWLLWIYTLLHTSLIQISIGKPTLRKNSNHIIQVTSGAPDIRVDGLVLEQNLLHWLRDVTDIASNHTRTQPQSDSTTRPSHESTAPRPPQHESSTVRVGDMVLERDLYDWLRGGVDHEVHHIIRRKIVRQRLWPFNSSYAGGVPTIPYVIDDSVSRHEKIINQAVNHWNKHTCLNFRKKKKHDTHYVKIFKGDGCWSQVGRSPDVGGQEVSIGDGCQVIATVIHELGHAIGLIHEHQRPDRDDYIHVNWGNIQDSNVDQFTKWDNFVVKRDGIPYDYTSVMQYGPMGFTKNGGLSMSTIPPKYQGLIGRHDGLSHRDKKAVNLAYGCIELWSANCLSATCEDEGYIGPDCKCVCPPGRSGDRCQNIKHDYYTLPSCSRIITEETTLSSPNYPYYIKQDTWCIYEIVAPAGFVPLITFNTFMLYGWNNDCNDDLLQIRHSNQYDGDVFCGVLDSGTQILGIGSTVVMYLEVKTSHSAGFQLQISWANASDSPAIVNPKPGDGPNIGVTNVIQGTIQYFMSIVHDIFRSFMTTVFGLIINIFLAFKFVLGHAGDVNDILL